jgi:predicted SAM-dependent methyltransferase
MLRFLKRILKNIVKLLGYEIHGIKSKEITSSKVSGEIFERYLSLGINRIHYGCGHRLLENWLNVDCQPKMGNGAASICVNLLARHPFPDNYFAFGFAEDFIEHLNQPDSIIFLCEVFRTFRAGGVLRLSFPGLEEVLNRHYLKSDYDGSITGTFEAYTLWEHLHFYSREELSLVCRHIGFREVRNVSYGDSAFDELKGLDFRKQQIGLNAYMEILK